MPRQTDYTDDKANIICERIADGESLKAICGGEDMPDKATVFRWLSVNETFRDLYARAREAQADALVDEIPDIADDGTNDWMERHSPDGENLGWRENGEAVSRSKLRVDARKWVAAKLRPKKYGEKLEVDQKTTLEAGDSFTNMLERIANTGKRLGVADNTGEE